MAEFITLYGPYVALLLVFLSWAGKNVWPVLVKRDEQEREERRQERQTLIELVKNNTEAMTKVTGAVDRLNDTVTFLSRDVAHIYSSLNLSRPERLDEEGLILPPSAHK